MACTRARGARPAHPARGTRSHGSKPVTLAQPLAITAMLLGQPCKTMNLRSKAPSTGRLSRDHGRRQQPGSPTRKVHVVFIEMMSNARGGDDPAESGRSKSKAQGPARRRKPPTAASGTARSTPVRSRNRVPRAISFCCCRTLWFSHEPTDFTCEQAGALWHASSRATSERSVDFTFAESDT